MARRWQSCYNAAVAGQQVAGNTSASREVISNRSIGMDTDSGMQSDTGTEDTIGTDIIEAVGAGEVLSTGEAGSLDTTQADTRQGAAGAFGKGVV